MNINLTQAEADALKEFLNQLEEFFENAGCNDMYLKNTPENKQLAKDATSLLMEPEDAEECLKEIDEAKGKNFITMDTTILQYLQLKLFGKN